MPDRVFTAEAMQACAERGHRWRFVRYWHAHGFDECATCGDTRSRGGQWGVAPADAALAADVTPSGRKVRTPQDVERNAEIVRLVAEGVGPSAVARQFNIDPSRVSQIVAKHRAAALAATTGGS